MKLLSRSAGIAAVLVAALAVATAAHADPLKCKQEIAKDFAKYVQAKAKSMQKCREAIVKGKIPGPCPDTTAVGKIAKAESKMRAGIGKQCGGTDAACGGAADESFGSIGWPDVCANFLSQTCVGDVTDTTCNAISNCLVCVGESAVDQSISLYYDNLASGEFGSGSDINKCQAAIGKNATKFLAAKSKALQKCEASVMKGSLVPPCPDPVTAQAAIDKAESKKVAKICKACGGPDKVCGGGDDLTPAQIYGAVPSCPNVGTCGGAISTLQDVITCVDCLTEFDADCLDALAVPSLKSYPNSCGTGVAPAPCPTATPGIVCPTKVVTEASGEAVDLDTGWTGQSHDAHAPSHNRLILGVSGCTQPTTSTCGVCNTNGPQDNNAGRDFDTHRCVADTSVTCTTNADCSGPGGACSFFFGAPLPLSSGGVSVCVTNQITAPITGTTDFENGTTSNLIQLLSIVYLGPTTDEPCPRCVAGLCDSGPHTGQACTINGHSDLFGDVSFDCPPASGGVIGQLPIPLLYTTGTQTRTLTSASPDCRDVSSVGLKCFCDTCDNQAKTPCASNADCVAVGAAVCGGTRCLGGGNAGAPCSLNSECPGGGCSVPGQQTKPNDCDDLTCTPTLTCVGGSNNFADCSASSECPGGACTVGNEGECVAGPIEAFCTIETFRGCASDSDCQKPGDTCKFGKHRDCFTDNGIASKCVGGANNGNACTVASECPGGTCGGTVKVTGVPYPTCGPSGTGAIGALFCIPPTSSSSVNSVSGLPGLGRVLLPYAVTFKP